MSAVIFSAPLGNSASFGNGASLGIVAAALLTAALLFLANPVASHAASKDDPFELITLPSRGRTLGAELADFDGDGRCDLLQIVSTAAPPNESRLLLVYLQDSQGGLPKQASFEHPVPTGSAAYDLADLTEAPGIELVFLNQTGVIVMSVGSPDAALHRYEIGATTLGAGADERGLERLQMIFETPGQPAWIAIPSFDGPVVLDASGKLIGRLDSPGRANYFIPQESGLAFVESDAQLFFDGSHVSTGDVDGDGRVDLVSTTRHALRVFLQTPEGLLPSEPSQTLGLSFMSERDHIRGSGGVAGEIGDIDGDGRVDLVLTHVAGSLLAATVTTHVYLNRDGSWNLDQPDRTYRSPGAMGSDSLMDLDGDGFPELLRATIEMSVLEVIEILLTRELDIRVAIFRAGKGKRGEVFGRKAVAEFKIELPLNFDSFRPAGFLANVKADLNNDGYRDLIRSGDGDEIALYTGNAASKFRRRAARQKVDTRGIMNLGDWNGDGLPDLLLFDPKIPEVPVRLLINRGKLPPAKRSPR